MIRLQSTWNNIDKGSFDPKKSPVGMVVRSYTTDSYRRYSDVRAFVKTDDTRGGSWLVVCGSGFYRERLSDQDMLMLYGAKKFMYTWEASLPKDMPERNMVTSKYALESAKVPVTWIETVSGVEVQLAIIANSTGVGPSIGLKFSRDKSHIAITASDLIYRLYKLTETGTNERILQCNVDYNISMPWMSAAEQKEFLQKGLQYSYYNEVVERLSGSLKQLYQDNMFDSITATDQFVTDLATKSSLFDVFAHTLIDQAYRYSNDSDQTLIASQHPAFLNYSRPDYMDGGIARHGRVIYEDCIPSMHADVCAGIESTVIVDGIGEGMGQILRNYHPDDTYIEHLAYVKEREAKLAHNSVTFVAEPSEKESVNPSGQRLDDSDVQQKYAIVENDAAE